MLPFLIKRLVLMSSDTQRARTINFHKRATVITGENDTGKSSVIKSIYYAFGAEPRMLKPWRETVSKILVHFSVGDRDFSLLRNGSSFTIFDKSGTPLDSFTSVTKGLGIHLAQLFRFGIKLTSQSGELITPPPAYQFLPFYIDQDIGWVETWQSFEKLQQIKSWRRDLIEYHVGLKPNSYYEIKGKHLQVKAQMVEAQAQAKMLKTVRDQIGEKYQEIEFNIDLEEFQEEIRELLVHCGELQKASEKIKEKLVELYNAKMEIESQIEIVSNALGEVKSDYKFLERLKDHVDCPTCGASYTVSFAEIFGIALDEGKLEELLQKLLGDLQEVNGRIGKMSGEHHAHDLETAKVRALLEKRREQVQLKDLIDSESKKKLKSVLQANLTEANLKTVEIQQEIDELKVRMDSFTSREKKAEIVQEFKALMKRYLFDLSVVGLTEDSYSDFTAKIHDQGSDQPRAVLAYSFSILQLMQRRASSAFCPIIIDSPIQQEQDAVNHQRILEFIKEHRPDGSQLILGVVDTKNVDFGGDVITLNQKRHVLREDEYDVAMQEMLPFIRSALEFRPPEHGLL
jgi:hypothetical protein